MDLKDIKVGQTVVVLVGRQRCVGVVEAVNNAIAAFPDGYVQVDIGFIIWLGSPDKVEAVPVTNS